MACRPTKGALLVQLAGIETADAVDELRGTLIEAPDDEVERDDDDSYFIHELIGLDAVTEDRELLGKVTEVLQPGGADVYVVTSEKGELLFPAIADVVRSIDLEQKQIVIFPMSGAETKEE